VLKGIDAVEKPKGFNVNSRGWNPRKQTNLHATPNGVEHEINGRCQHSQIHI